MFVITLLDFEVKDLPLSSFTMARFPLNLLLWQRIFLRTSLQNCLFVLTPNQCMIYKEIGKSAPRSLYDFCFVFAKNQK